MVPTWVKGNVTEPLRVEVPDETLAEALMRRLHSFPTEIGEGRGFEVRVTLVGNPDRAVTEVLHVVDEWLLDSGLERVRVHLDERTYTLNQPQPS